MRAARFRSDIATRAMSGRLVVFLICALLGCGKTVDTLGSDGSAVGGSGGMGGAGGAGGAGESSGLGPVTRPISYPNPFRDLLGKSEAEIDDKVDAAFKRLFYGDPSTEAVYFGDGPERAYIRDIHHDDIRSEGIGWGMMICVQLDKQEPFDRLWAYAKSELRYTDGAGAGYFRSRCDASVATTASSADCTDPYGHEQIATALLFAHHRWQTSRQHDYEADALEVFDVMLNKETANGGVVDGVTNLFDAKTGLPFHLPDVSSADVTRPALPMPAYYQLWAEATGNEFWKQASKSSRAYFQAAAHPKTGLLPVRTDFAGVPVEGWGLFAPEGYRAQLNIALDSIWFASDPWQVNNADALLTFFLSKGLEKYGQSYELDGSSCRVCAVEPALVAMNGITATIATINDRVKFVEAVWEMSPPGGNVRYFPGMLHLLALLVLSGQYRVY